MSKKKPKRKTFEILLRAQKDETYEIEAESVDDAEREAIERFKDEHDMIAYDDVRSVGW